VISVNVKFFAITRDIAGKDETIVSIPEGSTPSAVLESLAKSYPGLREWMGHLRVAVNLEYTGGDVILKDCDEVALIPPVSGG
jgi:molybdopterin converting factor subunit 1